jgi:hypothetical protein
MIKLSIAFLICGTAISAKSPVAKALQMYLIKSRNTLIAITIDALNIAINMKLKALTTESQKNRKANLPLINQ